jgi:hypothetical protein
MLVFGMGLVARIYVPFNRGLVVGSYMPLL